MSQTRTPLSAADSLTDEDIAEYSKYTDQEGRFLIATRRYYHELTPFIEVAKDRNGGLTDDIESYHKEYDEIKPSIRTKRTILESLHDKGTNLLARLNAATVPKETILQMKVPTEKNLLDLYQRHGLNDATVQSKTLGIKTALLGHIKSAQTQRKVIEDEEPGDIMLEVLNEYKTELATHLKNLNNIINLVNPAPGTLTSGAATFAQPKSPPAPKAAAPSVSPPLHSRPAPRLGS